MRSRVTGVLAVFAAAAAILASASTAAGPPKAGSRAVVVNGTLGTVTEVTASGNDDASRSAPSKTPAGIELGGGSASASARRGERDASASATAEARAVDLLDGTVTADRVSRAATADGKGPTAYEGSVEGLAIGAKRIGDVHSGKSYPLPDGAGSVTLNEGGTGLLLILTKALAGYPAGTRVAVADVTATARDGAPKPTPTPTPTATAAPQATATPTPPPTTTIQRKPRPRRAPAYKARLNSSRFEFPVRGKTRIGGPFGSFRSDTGSHQGNDLFANFGTPVVAVADGTVEKVGSLKISGNRLWVDADTGDQFFYAHLSAFSPEAVDGAHVEAGTVLGYVGNTGDAEPTPPHLHFEIHPDGGDAVDPEPFLKVWQARAGDPSTDTAERPGALVEVRDLIGEG